MAGKFEIFTDRDSRFRFRLVTGNGTVLAVSGGYDQKAQAVAAITTVRENAATGHITDLTAKAAPSAAQPDTDDRQRMQLSNGRARMDAALRRPAPANRPGTGPLAQEM